MHFQTSIPGWPEALYEMPDDCLVKSVNDPSLLVEAWNRWVNSGRSDERLWLDYRHHDLFYPDFDGVPYDWDNMIGIWRANFRRFVDATYLRNYAPYVNLVEELNEYTDNRMVKGSPVYEPGLLDLRLLSAQAACWVWNREYRGKTIVVDGAEAKIPDDCKLVICNSPVGNDIPREYYQLSVSEDAPLGVHPYTHWVDKIRDPQDFRYHSGRWHYNEQEYGIRPQYVFTECSPYNGSTDGGWRHSTCLGGDIKLLDQAMAAWWNDVVMTDAFQAGRILGPGAWFTSKTTQDQWKYYLLWASDLRALAITATEIWNVPEQPTPPPPAEDRGKPRVDYRREYWVLSVGMTEYQENLVFAAARSNRNTVGWSYDDSGIGDLSKRFAVIWNLPEEQHQDYLAWYDEFYPGVEVTFRHSNELEPTFLQWPVRIPTHIINHPFGEQRDYGLHEGIDIYAANGDPVVACRDGIVVWASDQRRTGGDSAYGNHIIIEHDDGWITWYCHLSDMLSAVGDVVARGDVIGEAGSTGNSTGPHLHLTVQHVHYGLDGYIIPDVVDPEDYL